VLAAGSTPSLQHSGQNLTAALAHGRRQRRTAAGPERILAAFREPQLRQDRLVEQAMGAEALTLLALLNAVRDSRQVVPG
jgi:hypothetical protein